MTFVLGLTGSIGMGKSTTAAMFRAEGVPVHDADAVVHAIYRGEAARTIAAAFPEAATPGGVDRAALGRIVFADTAALARLEAIVHPLVHEAEQGFMARCLAMPAPVAVLDIPLLFETGGEGRCDAVVVVTASAEVQARRVLAREGMTRERFEAILARQMPDAEKRRRAHFLVDTGHGLESAAAAVRSILRAVAGRAGRRYPAG